MAPDLGLVADAAQAHPHKAAAQRLGDRPPKRGLAGARGPDKAEDRALHLVASQLPDGQMLQDTFLGLGEAIVRAIQQLGGLGDVQLVCGGFLPGQLDQPLHIGADHAHLGRSRRHGRQAGEFFFSALAYLVGHLGGVDALSELLDVLQVRVRFP